MRCLTRFVSPMSRFAELSVGVVLASAVAVSFVGCSDSNTNYAPHVHNDVTHQEHEHDHHDLHPHTHDEVIVPFTCDMHTTEDGCAVHSSQCTWLTEGGTDCTQASHDFHQWRDYLLKDAECASIGGAMASRCPSRCSGLGSVSTVSSSALPTTADKAWVLTWAEWNSLDDTSEADNAVATADKLASFAPLHSSGMIPARCRGYGYKVNSSYVLMTPYPEDCELIKAGEQAAVPVGKISGLQVAREKDSNTCEEAHCVITSSMTCVEPPSACALITKKSNCEAEVTTAGDETGDFHHYCKWTASETVTTEETDGTCSSNDSYKTCASNPDTCPEYCFSRRFCQAGTNTRCFYDSTAGEENCKLMNDEGWKSTAAASDKLCTQIKKVAAGPCVDKSLLN